MRLFFPFFFHWLKRSRRWVFSIIIMIYINLSIKKSKWTNYQDFLGQDKEKKKNEIAFVRWKLSTQDYSNCNALCKQSLSFSCLILASSRKTAWIEWDLCWACVACCWNTVSKTGLIVLRYSAGTAGSVMTVDFSVNEWSHFQGINQFRQNLLLSFLIKKMTKLGSTRRITAVKMLRQQTNFDILKFLLGSEA